MTEQQQLESHGVYLGFIGFALIFVLLLAAAAVVEVVRDRRARR
jgi:hypothetical protein